MAVWWFRVPFVLGVALGLVASGLALVTPVAGAERAGACRSGFVSLTFDDGPAGPTARLVRILRRARVPATFFMVGQRVAAMPTSCAGWSEPASWSAITAGRTWT